MKIINWNCNGAFRKKFYLLEKYDADLFIIQEAENPDKSTNLYKQWVGNHYFWDGKNKNRGLAIFSRFKDQLTILDWLDGGILEQFIPFKFQGKVFLAVWTKQANSPTFQYIGQLWKYIQLNKEFFKEYKPIIIGDFNSNTIWDKWDRWWNHSDVVRELRKLGIQSLYHYQFNEKQGQESHNTFFMYRKPEKGYHIDYIFVPDELIELAELRIGKFDDWIEYSDHVPLFLRIDD